MPATKEGANWITAAQAADRLNTTILNVLMHIKRGVLAGEEREDVWYVDSASLLSLQENRKAGSAPVVCQSGCGRKAGGCGSCG